MGKMCGDECSVSYRSAVFAIDSLPSACGYVAAMLGGGSFAGDVLASYVIKQEL